MAAALSAMVVPLARGAEAQSTQVVILHPLLDPVGGDSLTAEAVARMTGELQAAGFSVLAMDVDPTRDLDTQIEAVSNVARPLATFAIQRGISTGVVDVWFSNRRARETRVKRIDLSNEPPGRAPGVLAVRAAELLRGFLEELRAPVQPTTVTTLRATAPPVPSRRAASVGLLLGGLAGNGRLPATLAAGALTQWKASERLDLVAAIAAGSDATISDAQGKLSLRRWFATLGGQLRFRRAHVWQPFVGAELGVNQTSGTGESTAAGQGATRTAWSLLLGSGGGLALVWRSLELRAEARAQWLTPRPVINIGDQAVARVGPPIWFFGLTTSWRFAW